METVILGIVVAGIVGIALGFAIAKVLEKKNASKIISGAKTEANTILKEAKSEGENIKKDKILQAKEKFLELKSEHEKVIASKDKKMAEAEKRIRDKESQVSNELAQNKRLKDELEEKNKEAEHRLQSLNKKQEEIADEVRDTLEGHLRAIIGQMKLEAIVTNRASFSEKVQENATKDLEEMGLEIVAFNIQGLIDEKGVIENLGIDNTEQIRKEAAKAKARAQQEIAEQQAASDKLANDARVAADLEIAQKQNDLAKRQAALKFLPVRLQGRQALLPGLRAWREDHRCHRPLRDRGSGRGTDHRAVGASRRPHLQPGRSAGAGAQHGKPCAGPGGALFRRAARVPEPAADGDPALSGARREGLFSVSRDDAGPCHGIVRSSAPHRPAFTRFRQSW